MGAGRAGAANFGDVAGGAGPARWPSAPPIPRLLEVSMDYLHEAVALLARPEFDVVAWRDPLCDDGIPADSDEALVILCPRLGPSATLMLHRLARCASSTETTWEPSVFKATFGLSSERTHDVAAKAIARLARFGFVTIRPRMLEVRTRVPP